MATFIVEGNLITAIIQNIGNIPADKLTIGQIQNFNAIINMLNNLKPIEEKKKEETK